MKDVDALEAAERFALDRAVEAARKREGLMRLHDELLRISHDWPYRSLQMSGVSHGAIAAHSLAPL